MPSTEPSQDSWRLGKYDGMLEMRDLCAALCEARRDSPCCSVRAKGEGHCHDCPVAIAAAIRRLDVE
jgi:hypothetical protein